jgi:hypothetical protein
VPRGSSGGRRSRSPRKIQAATPDASPHEPASGVVRSPINSHGDPCVYAAKVPAIFVPEGAFTNRSTFSDVPRMTNGCATVSDRATRR